VAGGQPAAGSSAATGDVQQWGAAATAAEASPPAASEAGQGNLSRQVQSPGVPPVPKAAAGATAAEGPLAHDSGVSSQRQRLLVSWRCGERLACVSLFFTGW
jgi:hypothetical protein